MQTNSSPESEKRELELIKLEYQQAAQRFENIYKAIWQIFSYMAVLTGAILTFGSSQLSFRLMVFISVFPLLFWWIAIFTILDRYGQKVRQRLKDIEYNVNRLLLIPSRYQMRHYIEFSNQGKSNSEEKSNWMDTLIREPPVSLAVNVSGTIIFSIWFIVLISSFTYPHFFQIKPNSEIVPLEPPVQIQLQDSQIQELQKELSTLSLKIDSIEDLLRQRSIDDNKP